ncbi:MAG: hypothetical protein JWP88_187 [Flaviaesturariibacter sp.]|nr:hypothetical protein [Flaviaesturariibacter sp.]
MQSELRGLNLEILNSMHQQAHNRLHKSLQGGASNLQISQQQEILNELTIAINHELRRRFSDPAASQRHHRPVTNRIPLSQW